MIQAGSVEVAFGGHAQACHALFVLSYSGYRFTEGAALLSSWCIWGHPDGRSAATACIWIMYGNPSRLMCITLRDATAARLCQP
jgi:hypothetical protein